MTEIRWHARAGQGAVTAAKLVADYGTAAGQLHPGYARIWPRRAGAPLKAYTRVSNDPIEVHNNIQNPDIVIIMDDTLLASTDVMEGMPEDGILLFNTTMTAAEARAAVDAPESMRVAVVDASGIALATIQEDMPNTPRS